MMQPENQQPTTDLVREAVNDTRELVRLEVALAKDEVRQELKDAERCGIAFGVAALFATLAAATLLAVVVVAIGWLGGLILGGALLVIAGGMGLVGFKMLPKKPLAETRKRIEKDVHGLKERMA